jgi:hypothetical protein
MKIHPAALIGESAIKTRILIGNLLEGHPLEELLTRSYDDLMRAGRKVISERECLEKKVTSTKEDWERVSSSVFYATVMVNTAADYERSLTAYFAIENNFAQIFSLVFEGQDIVEELTTIVGLIRHGK